MLVLSRKMGERIVIQMGPTAVVLTLIENRGGRARLGFEATSDVTIHREEIYRDIARNGRREKTDPRTNGAHAGDRRQAIAAVDR